MSLKKRPDQIAVYIVWKSVCHTSCNGGACCLLTLSPCEHVVVARSQALLEVLMPALQSSHLAQTYPTSVHACGLAGLEKVHVETLNKQRGPNLVFATPRSIASHHTLAIARPCPERRQHLKHSIYSLESSHSVSRDTMATHWWRKGQSCPWF